MRFLTAVCYFVLLSTWLKHGALNEIRESKSKKDASLEVRPDSRQHLRGKEFTLHCSVNGGNSTGWILRRLQGDQKDSGCLYLNGTKSTDKPEECHFSDIDSKNNGLYWCESLSDNKTSNTVNITVTRKDISSKSEVTLLSTVNPMTKDNSTSDSEEENQSGLFAWVSGLCMLLVPLVTVPVLWIFFPSFREKLYACTNGAYRRERVQQEMPKTKQDATEIQWDLPWMEMDNLLGKQQNAGR
nr:uncharacterized protein si:dkey-170g13.2 [Danio rerio]|eukprot:XP_021327470.1 uncharacterized protein si:dkey-170g13.2 [Danio rerio]